MNFFGQHETSCFYRFFALRIPWVAQNGPERKRSEPAPIRRLTEIPATAKNTGTVLIRMTPILLGKLGGVITEHHRKSVS